MSRKEIEHELETRGSVIVEWQRMASVRLEGDLNGGSVGVCLVQGGDIGQISAIASANIKVKLWQQELHGGLERWAGVSKQ